MFNNQPSDPACDTFSQVCTIPGSDFSIKYDLLRCHSDGRTFYSIKVSFFPDGENATVHDITSNRDLAYRIFKMLCAGIVTPCCVFEVVEDLIETIL